MKFIDFSYKQSAKTMRETTKQSHELMPLFKQFYNLEHKKIPMFPTEYVKSETNHEDSSNTNFISQKIIYVMNLKAMIAISLMFMGYFAYYYEVDQTRSRDLAIFIYIFISILTGLIIVVVCVESYLYRAKNRIKKILQEAVVESSWMFGLKILCFIIHPNIIFFRDKYIREWYYGASYKVPEFKRNFNEYLFIFQFTYLYFIVAQAVIYNTMWANDSSDRITRMVGFRINLLYLIKCLMRDAKKTVAISAMTATLLYYTIMLKVAEGPRYINENGSVDYRSFAYPAVTLWNAMVTFFTIGYGDVWVSTYFGRTFISFLALISGIILSFITVSMTIDFDFGDTDKKAFVLINSVELKREVDVAAAQFIKAFLQYRLTLKSTAKVPLVLLKNRVETYRRAFSAKLNEYKNSRSYDVLTGIYKALCTFEDQIEADEAKYQIAKKN